MRPQRAEVSTTCVGQEGTLEMVAMVQLSGLRVRSRHCGAVSRRPTIITVRRAGASSSSGHFAGVRGVALPG